MLVLSRHKDEVIMIGDLIKITIVGIQHDRVKIGIDAPVEVPVHRQEVYDAIKAGFERRAKGGANEAST